MEAEGEGSREVPYLSLPRLRTEVKDSPGKGKNPNPLSEMPYGVCEEKLREDLESMDAEEMV